jgi:hypothetical protein
MHLFAITLILSIITTSVLAAPTAPQLAPTSSATISPSLTTTPLTAQNAMLPPSISGYSQTGCINTGGSVTILGRNFGSQKTAILGGHGIIVPLTISSWSNNQIIAMIPNNPGVAAGQGYYIGISDPKTGTWLSNIDKYVSICAAAIVVVPTVNPNVKLLVTVPLQSTTATTPSPTTPPTPTTPATPGAPTVPPPTSATTK